VEESGICPKNREHLLKKRREKIAVLSDNQYKKSENKTYFDLDHSTQRASPHSSYSPMSS
jgi:hypothetical protein